MAEILPEDGFAGTLIGRVNTTAGPSVVAIRHNGVFDITGSAATVADLCNVPDPVGLARSKGDRLGDLEELLPTLLAPIDLQAIKAAGVTFAVSLLERLIEEHSKGDLSRADEVRKELNSIIGVDITTIKPGTPDAEALKKTLVARGAWSPYLEVGIGPYAEIFTKAPPMSAVGYGAEIGIRPDSDWNNPEPEVTLIVNAAGKIVGATLGPSAVSLVEIATQVQVGADAILSAASYSVTPSASWLDARGDRDRLTDLLVKGTRLSVLATVPFVVMPALLAPELVRVWLGAESSEAAGLIVVALAYILVTAPIQVGSNLLVGVGRARAVLWPALAA